MNTAKKIILATRNTLNDVDVRGIENMRKLLGCYDALGTALQNLEAAPGADQEAEEVPHG